MLDLADRNHDGRPTWGEVFADPKRIFGLVQADSLKLASRKEFMKANDTNRNGLVDRAEARRFVSEMKLSEALFFVESAVDFHLSGGRQSIVTKLLDVDGDGVLARRELTTLEQRLLIRDANDDRMITWPELDDSLAGDELATARQKLNDRNDRLALPLGLGANWQFIQDAIQQNGPAPPGQSLLNNLDADADGSLDPQELLGLNVVEPHVVLAVDFGNNEKEKTTPRLTLEQLSPPLVELAAPLASQQVAIFSPSAGFRLRFILDDRIALKDRWSSAEAQLAALDANRNGYLEPNEAAVAFDTKTFGEADANSDGKLQLAELTIYWISQRTPQLSTIHALVSSERDVFFSALDTNHDQRLATRELRGGTAALGTFDTDQDGRITHEEVPEALVIVLGRRQPSAQTLFAPILASSSEVEAAPKWFRHMDANGDQEVSRDEFPGSSAKFRSLDRDADGFITPSEAHDVGSLSR